MTAIKRIPFELLIWVGAIVVLYHLDTHDTHANSICPIHWAGFDWCPGCGLGRSIALLMHGDFKSSLQMHWLGIPALVILVHRIITLFKAYINQLKHNK